MSRNLKSRSREIVVSVYDYFENEKIKSEPLLKRVYAYDKISKDQEEVKLPKSLITEIIEHLKKNNSIAQNTSTATKVCKRSVFKILNEKDQASATCSRLKSPTTKKRRLDTTQIDNFDLTSIRNIIHSLYVVKKEVPTLRKVLMIAKNDMNFPYGKTTLWKILRDKLGYKFKKCASNRKQLIERPNIQSWRAKYLQRMRENDALGYQKKPVVYLDETFIHNNYTVKKCWQSTSNTGVQVKSSSGRRYIIVHAGDENGFIKNAQLVFKANTKTGDYHDQMNTENFTKWIKEKLLPNIPPNSIIVMDNAPYHSKEEKKNPGISSRKGEMVQCDLNPIELIWHLVKQRVAEKNVEQLESKIEELTLEAIASITPDDWRKEVNHVKRLEEEYCQKDRLFDQTFIIETGEESSSDEWTSSSDASDNINSD